MRIQRQMSGLFSLAPLIMVLLGWVLPACVTARDPDEKALERFRAEIRTGTAALDSVRSELERGRRQLKELERREASSLARLQQLETNLNVGNELVGRMSAAVDSMDSSLTRLHLRLGLEQEKLRERQKVMEARLRAMYRTGDVNLFQLFFSAATATDMVYRIRWFQRLKGYDAQMLSAIRSVREEIALRAVEIEVRRDAQVALVEQHRADQAALDRDRENQRRLVAQIQEEREAYLVSVRELEAASKEMQLLLDKLHKRAEKAREEYERALTVQFEQRKGVLAWPVEGEIVRPFGKIVHPVYKTVTFNNGVDIRTEPGSLVRCVAPGRVIYIGRMRGLGRFIVVDHFGGYLTVYARLAAVTIAPDTDVEYGTVLGRVDPDPGDSQTRLHFEVRLAAQSLDPSLWLESL